MQIRFYFQSTGTVTLLIITSGPSVKHEMYTTSTNPTIANHLYMYTSIHSYIIKNSRENIL